MVTPGYYYSLLCRCLSPKLLLDCEKKSGATSGSPGPKGGGWRRQEKCCSRREKSVITVPQKRCRQNAKKRKCPSASSNDRVPMNPDHIH